MVRIAYFGTDGCPGHHVIPIRGKFTEEDVKVIESVDCDDFYKVFDVMRFKIAEFKGWTILGIPASLDDHRPGSKTVIFIEGKANEADFMEVIQEYSFLKNNVKKLAELYHDGEWLATGKLNQDPPTNKERFQLDKDDGYIHFVKNTIKPIKTNVKKDELKQVRIIPQATCYVVEVVYERKEIDLGLDKDNFLSIDLGLNNLCSCISNVGLIPFIVNGRIMKSFNQWYNKKKAKLMSFVGDRGYSNRIRRITLFRNCWIEDKLHKISRYIVNFCRSNNIGTIIIGLNKEWKQEINIGRRNNQHFVSIPHSKLIDKIVYKAKLLGINVVIHEESYTSKIDHLAFEPLKKQESYLGKRKKRGLFQSSIGKLINADINGSIGIARKVIGDSFIGKIIDSGFVFNPIRVNTL